MKNLSKLTALAAACALTAITFCSCAEEENGGSYSLETNNKMYEYSGDQESSEEYCEAEAEESAGDNGWNRENSNISAEKPSANEKYVSYEETGFKNPETEPLSTFSADVDTASFSNIRRMLEDGQAVPEDAVRIEEIINYFDYDYPEPENGEIFGRYAEIADCPWNSSAKLMMIGIQGKRMEQAETPPSNLVFLIDSSGSMSDYNKLPLVQTAFSMLAENLTVNDNISIVTYASSSRTVIDGVSGNEKDRILEGLYSINANGATNGEGGIERAYELAEKHFIKGGNNRVIIATDGDLNIGASTGEELTELIESKRDKGIYLSVLGFGTGNLNDENLEALADNGNGNYSYIDSVDEAERVLVQEMSGTMYAIAKDVKLQVEFNPSQVKSYRLIGYDNRIMVAEDFRDNTKDAGEVGAGHSVTALYEIELAYSQASYNGIELEFADQHQQKTTVPQNDNKRTELCKLSVAYKDIDTDEDVYLSALFGMEKYSGTPSTAIRLAGAAAEFGMILRDSQYKGSSDFNYITEQLADISDNEKTEEFLSLSITAAALYE